MRLFFLLVWTSIHLFSLGQQSQATKGGAGQQIAQLLQEAKQLYVSDLPGAVTACQNALQLAQSRKLPQEELNCYLTLTTIYKHYDQPELVVRNYDRAIALDLSPGNRLHYAKLPYLERIADREKGIQDAKRIAKIAKKEGNREEQANAYITLGNLYGKAGNYEKSLDYLTEAEDLVQRTDFQKQAAVQGYIGDNYSKNGQNRKAEQYYRNSISNSVQAKDPDLIETNFDRMNNLYRQENRNAELKDFNGRLSQRGGSLGNADLGSELEDTLALVVANSLDEKQARSIEQKANINLAEVYLEENDGEEAVDILEDLNQETQQEENLEQATEVKKLLANAYDKTGKYEQALETYKEFVRLQDSLLEQKDRKIQASQAKYIAFQELEGQISLLEKDRQLDAKTIALNRSDMRRQRTIMFAILAVMGIFLLALLLIARKNRARARAYDLLELKSLRTKMNPHFIFNSLNSVNHYIAQNDEKAANRYLSSFSKLMRDVLDTSDKDFIPLGREIELLKVYLALEHQRFSDKFEYDFTVDPAIDHEDFRIPPMLVQPFIENAIWHGLRYIEHAGKLEVRFRQAGENLLIEVEDNGIGREASKALKTKSQSQHKSSGIRSSKSRVELSNRVYGGSIDIQILDKEGPETGTLVQISIENEHGD